MAQFDKIIAVQVSTNITEAFSMKEKQKKILKNYLKENNSHLQ